MFNQRTKNKNPQPKQQQHRAKPAFINRLSAHLAEAVNIGFARVPDADVKHTPRNAFVKKNWDNGALQWNEETGVWELCPKHLKVADGPRYIPDNMTAFSSITPVPAGIWGRLDDT